MNESARLRVFFALAPDAGVRRKLDAISASLPRGAGRRVPAANLHLTLLFLGGVPQDSLDDLCRDCDAIAAEPFHLNLDTAGRWKKPGIVWVGPEQWPAALMKLFAELNGAAIRHGLLADVPAFRPHVTLLRKASSGVRITSFEPVAWHVREYHLMQSITHPSGPEYRILATWPLAGAGPLTGPVNTI